MASIGLTAPEVHELTGYKRSSKQCEALAYMGVDFKVRPNGTVFVSRTFDNKEVPEVKLRNANTPKLRK